MAIAEKNSGATTIGYRSAPTASGPRTIRPVVCFAVVGAAVLLESIWVFGHWLADGPHRVASGPTKIPWYIVVNAHAQEAVFGLIAAVFLFLWVIRPLLRRQPLPWDGLLLLAIPTTLWQMFGVGWFRWPASYNTAFINTNSWYERLPAWSSSNPDGFAEAPIWDLGIMTCWALSLIWFCFIMRAIRRRWPQLGNAGLLASMVVFIFCFDTAMEIIMVRLGTWHWGGAPTGWHLLFQGHYYQFSLIEAFIMAPILTMMGAVRYFKNDKGQSFAERKVETLPIGRRGQTFVRFLAIVGIYNLLYFGANMAWQPFLITNAAPWPADIQKRSYFTQGICGANTDRACGGRESPISGPHGAYINTDGKVSYPPGYIPPTTVTFAK